MDLRITTLGLTLAILLLSSSVQTVCGQAYHFSNGWFPGRKRSLDTAYSSVPYRTESALRDCQIQPQVQQLLTELIQRELVRLVSECHLVTETNRSPATPEIRTQDITAWLQSMRHQEDSDDIKNI